MIGGLLKSSSKLALMAAAGILVGGVSMGSAKAADLGGDCCADLEERVAELEATTARKGNRKVSLTVSGQVNKQIMYYRDDVRSRTIAGMDNINNSSRFIFSGNAKIASSVTAGFEMMVEWGGANRSDLVSQIGTPIQHNTPVLNNSNISGDGSLAVRTANWWLEDKTMGRVTVGRVNIQGPASIIDISGGDVQLVAWSNPALQGGGMYLQRKDSGNMTSSTLAPSAGGPMSWCYGCSRDEGIRYDSASYAGFTFGAYWGSQDRFTGQVRYAAEFGGFQIAAGAGYERANRLGAELPNITTAAQPAITATSPTRTDLEQHAYALSVKHVASGLFAQANMGFTNYNMVTGVTAATLGKNNGQMYHIQAGIAKNWFGPGVSSVYGEYGHGEGYMSASGAAGNIAATTGQLWNFQSICNNAATCVVTQDSVNYYGLGMTQKIDAAAMTLYLGWRHFDPKISAGTTAATSTGIPISSVDTVIGGARIQF